jgi:hypothetical protein
VELGGSKMTVTDVDFLRVRQYLQPEGRILIKVGTFLRITDERRGDWIYQVTSNVFFPYEALTRPYLEEFIPDNIVFKERGERKSTMIGPQDNPHPDDRASDGNPVPDLLAMINLELSNGRTVFVLDGTLFHWRGRLYRANEELVFRPRFYTKVDDPDLRALESEWKIHPLVEDEVETDTEVPDLKESEEDLADLPFDTHAPQ